MQPQDFDVAPEKSGAFDSGNTFERDGRQPPGKMYLAIQGLVKPGPSERPIECRSITPSSLSNSARRRK